MAMLKYFLLILIFLLHAPAVFAADADNNVKSSTKDIAFIFYKLANKTPDFNAWAKASAASQIRHYGELGRREYLENVRKDLITEFNETNPETSYITVSVDALLEPLNLNEDNPSSRFLNIYFKEEPLFLSKTLPDYLLNIVIPKLEESLDLNVSDEEYQRLDKIFYSGIHPRNLIKLRLKLKPIRAEADDLMLYNDKEYALMLTKLIDFEIWNDIDHVKYWPLPPIEEEAIQQKKDTSISDFISKYQ